MIVKLQGIGKKFHREWIFKNLTFTFERDRTYAILGPNGSGKSTLMKLISGYLSPTEGAVEYIREGHLLDHSAIYRQLTYSAPYIDLVEEFTLEEQVTFNQSFKPLVNGITVDEVLQIADLHGHKNKLVRQLSSGMKQRLKIVLGILTDGPVVLLDEPTSNLDETSVEWYRQLILDHASGRIVIIASNQAREYSFCMETLDVRDWK